MSTVLSEKKAAQDLADQNKKKALAVKNFINNLDNPIPGVSLKATLGYRGNLMATMPFQSNQKSKKKLAFDPLSIKEMLTRDIISSVAENGLLPRAALNEEEMICLPSSDDADTTLDSGLVLTGEDNLPYLCINHIERKLKSEEEFHSIINTLMADEAVGIHSILQECCYTLPDITLDRDPKLSQELTERIRHSIVVIVKPPKEVHGFLKVFTLQQHEEALAVAQQKNPELFKDTENLSLHDLRRQTTIINDEAINYQFLELKLLQGISSDQFIAVMVPEKLLPMARKYFEKSITIIPVPDKLINVSALDIELEKYPSSTNKKKKRSSKKTDNFKKQAIYQVKVPDYGGTLLKSKTLLLDKDQVLNFACHAVRLPTVRGTQYLLENDHVFACKVEKLMSGTKPEEVKEQKESKDASQAVETKSSHETEVLSAYTDFSPKAEVVLQISNPKSARRSTPCTFAFDIARSACQSLCSWTKLCQKEAAHAKPHKS